MELNPLGCKQQLRELPSQRHVGSSEASPSDHSSLFDAAPFSHASRLSSGYASESDQDDGLSLAKGALQSILSNYGSPNLTNRSAGTRLFTITEQKSVPTLKTVPSNWTFQRRIATLPPQITHRAGEVSHSRAGHRRCLSVDENALQHHRGSEMSTSTSLTSGSDRKAGDRPAPLRLPMLPVHAPFKPPERIQTPAGLPRWPGERHYQPNAVREVVSSSQMSFRDSFNQYLHSSPAQGLRLRDVLRGRRRTVLNVPSRTGARFWRPPASAHSTRRFEGVESHPFAAAPIAKSGRARVGTDDDEARWLVREGTREQLARNLHRGQAALPAGNFSVASSEARAGSDIGEGLRRDLTASQRALRQISGNSMFVSPDRASTQASIRSIAVPAQVRRIMLAETGPEQSISTPGTTRTIDLFNSFPVPPSRTEDNQATEKSHRGCKPTSWSLFPGRVKRNDRQSGSSIGRKLQKRTQPQVPPEGRAGTIRVERPLPNVAIRGEDSARYRESGVAVYDDCRTSLSNLDRRQTCSIDSGTQALGTRVLQPQVRSESQRAVSNGALRFSILRETTIEQSNPLAHSGQLSIPTTIDIAEKLCKHGRTKLPTERTPLQSTTNRRALQFDGTSAPVPQSGSEPTVTATDYALPTTVNTCNAPNSSNRNPSVPHMPTDPALHTLPSTTFTTTHPNSAMNFSSPALLPTATFQTAHTDTPSVSGTLPGRA